MLTFNAETVLAVAQLTQAEEMSDRGVRWDKFDAYDAMRRVVLLARQGDPIRYLGRGDFTKWADLLLANGWPERPDREADKRGPLMSLHTVLP